MVIMRKFLCCLVVFLIAGSLFASTPMSFNTLIEYDIKGICYDNKIICPFNGFNHGKIDYGVYKQRGYYFAITMNNAVFGEGITILETVSFNRFDKGGDKGIECTLKEIEPTKPQKYKGIFVEKNKDGMAMLSITVMTDGKEHTIMYFMTLRDSE